jgi:hypothetical protein
VTTDNIEKRRYPRVFVDWPVIVLTSRLSIGGKAVNISMGGALITCPTCDVEEESLRLVIKTPLPEKSLLVSAEIAWSELDESADLPTLKGIGLRFTRFSTDDRQFLTRMIREKLQSTD